MVLGNGMVGAMVDHEPENYTTEDGATVAIGDRVYDYYSMKAGKIVRWAGNVPDPWFDVEHDDGTTTVLNGQRICTIEHAQYMGWPGV